MFFVNVLKVRKTLWLTAVFILLLSACANETAPEPTSEGGTAVEEVAEAEETAVESNNTEIEIALPVEETVTPKPTNTPQNTPAPLPTKPNDDGSITTTNSGLQYEEIEEGDGGFPVPGDVVSVHYVGTLEDGTVFDNSIDRGQPIQFALGNGNVIDGWEEGISLMRVGGKARLIIPPNLAYGTAGAGGVIPPNATLTFEVELIEIVPPLATPIPPEPPTQLDQSAYTETEAGILFAVLQEGDGEMPIIGDSVSFHFNGWLADDESSIGSSYERGTPVDMIIGREEILRGWDRVLPQMKEGEITQFIFPPEWGLGEDGSPPVIPPNATLIFEIELIAINEPPPTPQAVNPDDLMTTESGLQYVILEEGEGPMPEAGQTVMVNYRGWLQSDNFQFDNSYDREQPFEFQIGLGSVIAGWDEGVALMRVGDKIQLIIPPELAYGAGGTRSIPPDSTLIFEVELLEIK